MTSSTATNPSAPGERLEAFTLVELLVVMGIIIVLAGLLLGGLTYARRSAASARMRSDLATISQGLEAYRDDFKDYPRIDYAGPLSTSAANELGAVTLCWALLSPGPASQDGADGFGFRKRASVSGNTNQNTGQVYGPYLQPGRFRVGGTDDHNATINDSYDHPILYFPLNRAANPQVANGYVAQVATNTGSTSPAYNINDNTLDPPPPNMAPTFNLWAPKNPATPPGDMMRLLGADGTGKVAAGKSAITVPYLLWSAGVDELYGLDPTSGKSDDITNFDLPADLRR